MTLRLTEAERAEILAAVPDDEPVGPWVIDAALMRARVGLTIPAMAVVNVIRSLVEFPYALVCRHYVAGNLLSMLEEYGVHVSSTLAKAVVGADDGTALNELSLMRARKELT